jgi:hypothetical protein
MERKEMEQAMLDSTVNDHVPTGTPGVLDSPHVSEGPGKIANAPVPSVFVRWWWLLLSCECKSFPFSTRAYEWTALWISYFFDTAKVCNLLIFFI